MQLAQSTESEKIAEKSTLIDERDGTEYEIIKIDSTWWFNENLNYWTEESNCFKNLDSNCEKSGRLYAYSELNEICPKNWSIPSEKDFDNLIEQSTTYENKRRSIVYLKETWETINSQNDIKLKFQKTGFRHKKKYKSESSMNLWLALETGGSHLHMYIEKKSNQFIIFRHNHEEHNSIIKKRKFAVRCICNETNMTTHNTR